MRSEFGAHLKCTGLRCQPETIPFASSACRALPSQSAGAVVCGSVCNLRTVVDCSGSSSSKSNSMYSRRHKNAKLYFTFTLSHQRLCCQKGKREKGSVFFSFSSLCLSFTARCVCGCVFWSNVKCDARGNAQILSFIN